MQIYTRWSPRLGFTGTHFRSDLIPVDRATKDIADSKLPGSKGAELYWGSILRTYMVRPYLLEASSMVAKDFLGLLITDNKDFPMPERCTTIRENFVLLCISLRQ